MFEDVINLIAVKREANSTGEIEPTGYIKREVYASIRSVGQKEVYEAAAHGAKPSIAFVLNNRFDYENEDFVEYNGDVYKITRMFFKDVDEKLEIVCERTLNQGLIKGNE